MIGEGIRSVTGDLSLRQSKRLLHMRLGDNAGTSAADGTGFVYMSGTWRTAFRKPKRRLPFFRRKNLYTMLWEEPE